MNKKVEGLKSLILENVSIGMELVNDVNSWDNSLEHLQVFSMYEFDDILEGYNPSGVAQKIFYGNFNPNDEYFRFNGYANLESLNEYDLEEEVKSYAWEIAQRTVELYEEGHLPYLDNEVLEILEDQEDEEE